MPVWRYIYLVWAILCVVGGYRNLTAEHTANFYVPESFIVVGFFFFCTAPLAITALRNCFGIETEFRRPSFDRTVFNKRDILQAFRVFWVSATLMCVGAGFALRVADHNGVMMFWSGVAMSGGLFIGERIVYLVYAKQIT